MNRAARKTRRFTILDATILVAAIAVGFAYLRVVRFRWSPLAPTDRYCLTHSVLTTLSVATVLLRLREPRPPRRRLFLTPGAAACLSASLALLPTLLFHAGKHAVERRRFPFPTTLGQRANEVLLHAMSPTAYAAAVAGTWSVLLAGGVWKPDGSWIDRLGIAIGCSWIGLLLAAFASDLANSSGFLPKLFSD